MKRLFGQIGLIYLSVLTVAFYLYSTVTLAVLLISSTIITVVGIIFAALKNKKSASVIVTGVTIFAAAVAIFLYQNYYFLPVADNYSDKEISFEGYIYDEITIADNYSIIPIQTEKIDGDEVRTKINLSVFADFEVEEFDVVEGKISVSSTTNNFYKSRGIFLTSTQDDEMQLQSTGEKHFSLYSYAISARKAMKKALGEMLSRDSAALSKAILLGDKYALSSEIRHDFNRIGTTFLIVVSGLHLSIVCGFLTFILRKLKVRRIFICITMIIAVIAFAAITGFPRSVIRAGIMVIITYCGNAIHRKKDSLNSLGFAALVLTVTNPFAVGDLGLLMSFSATMGIILWAKKIDSFICSKLRIDKIKCRRIKKVIKSITNLVAVSISASLWIIPINLVAFNKIYPLTVLFATITEPIACVILVLSLIAVLIHICPFIAIMANPIAFVLDFICSLHININSRFASIPFSTIITDKAYLYIWMIISIILVIIGYIIPKKKYYVAFAISVSAVTLSLGWSIDVLTDTHTTEITLYQSGYGLTISVEKDENISLLCCGGSSKNIDGIIDEFYSCGSEIDDVFIPNRVNYSSYLPMLKEEFEITNLFINEKFYAEIGSKGISIQNNTTFSAMLNTDTEDRIINVGNLTYQYLYINDETVLFVPHYGDIKKLPEEYRTADYIIADGVPYNAELLSCDKLIYTGRKNERFENNYETLSDISNEITVLSNDTLKIKTKR